MMPSLLGTFLNIVMVARGIFEKCHGGWRLFLKNAMVSGGIFEQFYGFLGVNF